MCVCVLLNWHVLQSRSQSLIKRFKAEISIWGGNGNSNWIQLQLQPLQHAPHSASLPLPSPLSLPLSLAHLTDLRVCCSWNWNWVREVDQSRDPSSRQQQQEHQMPKGSSGRKDKAAHREGGVRREWGKGVGGLLKMRCVASYSMASHAGNYPHNLVIQAQT